MTTVQTPGGNRQAAPSSVWPLLSVVAAIMLWLGADELSQRAHETEVQLAAAAKRVSRGSAQEISARQAEAKSVEEKRQALARRLSSPETEQMTRAKLVYELRQKCNAVPVACQIRLADISSAESLKRSAADFRAEPSLEGLGISRARAVLSGTFKSAELLGLYAVFARDTEAQWKVNAVQIKGNGFELDMERLVLRQSERNAP